MKNEKNEYFWKKQQQFWEMPEKTKFFNFRASQNEEKTIFRAKKISPKYYAYMNHQKIFQSGLTSGSAGLRKNRRDPPTGTFWSPVL